ncbi:hypothetical protein [Rhodanobacter sp. B04]|uniref:hypothetical protein n=1 Tax=Rhodanobacter sp. B04 TaxID=1945860 RepID=UPI00111578B9|nr:hypothetical protein [Rhodanobacter sp. B04]
MSLLASLFFPKSRWAYCHQPTAAERMARYSLRHAADMQDRENAGAAAPRVRLIEGREVLVALHGRVNPLPKDHA